MRLIYSDEAGIGNKLNEPITVVAAIVVHPDREWASIQEDIQRILDDCVPQNRHAAFEFHAGNLFRRRARGQNAEVLRRFLEVIRAHEVPVAAGTVDRNDLTDYLRNIHKSESPNDAQHIAFALCASMVEAIFAKAFPKECGLWIADEARAKIPMKNTLRWFQKRPFDPATHRMHFKHIVDTVYFGHSHESCGIQLADACNCAIKQHAMGVAAGEPFYRIIEEQVFLLPWNGELIQRP